jgi:hypothetical protein
MKAKDLFAKTLPLAAMLLLFAGASHAGLYHVTIDTSALNLPSISGNGPFSLDFQLNNGSPVNNNTAVISNFSFGGGGAPFGQSTAIGGASGDLQGTISLVGSSDFNEFFQSFTAGSVVGFDLSLTQKVNGVAPDAFAIAILDNNLSNIPTTGFGNTLLYGVIDTTSPLTIRQLNLASGTGDYAGVTISAAPVPEPQTYAMLLAGLGLLGYAARRRG